MKESDAAAVLALAAAFDKRTIGETDVRAWGIALGALSPERCLQAVARYYGENSRPIMPSDVKMLARTTTDGDNTRSQAAQQPVSPEPAPGDPTTPDDPGKAVTVRLRDGTAATYRKPAPSRDPNTGSRDPRVAPFLCPACGSKYHGDSPCPRRAGPPVGWRNQIADWRGYFREQRERGRVPRGEQ